MLRVVFQKWRLNHLSYNFYLCCGFSMQVPLSFQIYSNFLLKLLKCAVAQLVSVSASDNNSKVRSSNPAGNKNSFLIG